MYFEKLLKYINSVVYNPIAPKMKHAHELVIPRIYTHWKDVAACLKYSQDTIEMMDEKWKGVNAIQCCEDMLRDWLCTDDSLHPSCSWETLIGVLKQVNQLISPAKQIEKDVEKLIRYVVMLYVWFLSHSRKLLLHLFAISINSQMFYTNALIK